jgi:hypothetical protein
LHARPLTAALRHHLFFVTFAAASFRWSCRATIRVRTPDNQGEKVVARLVS